MNKFSSIEIYKAANKQFCWRRRGINGRLLSGPVETFKSRIAVAKNLSANFGLCMTEEGVRDMMKVLPFEPDDNHLTVFLNERPVEIKGPSAPRRPRTHKEHVRKSIAATLK